MVEPLLNIKRMSLTYATQRGPVHALQDVSLAIPRGGAMGLVGESGSGKSSVVLAMLGLLGKGAEMVCDSALFDGQDLRATAESLRGRRIGMVFQDPAAALNPAHTIGFQVSEPLIQHKGLSREAAFARAVELLGEMGIARPAQVAKAYPHQLSGGMKQRAVIATALACEPELLLLDEPTTALDVTVEAQILDLLEKLRRERGVSMLLVSHNLGIVDRLCDELTVLYAGRVVEQGACTELLGDPRHPYTRGLLAALPRVDRGKMARLAPIPGGLPDLTKPVEGCNFLPRCPFAVEVCALPQALRVTDGRAVRCHRAEEIAGEPWPIPEAPDAAVRPEKPMTLLSAEGLTRSFGHSSLISRMSLKGLKPRTEFRAVDGVSLQIGRGEVLGLVGESGCGKSTLGRLVLRLLRADSGTLRFEGKEIANDPPTAYRRRAQIVFQNPDSSLNPRQTVDEALRRPLIRFGIASGAEATKEVERLLDLVRLPPSYRQRYPHQMSGGEKQRIGIARALASRPDFLVCDEAVSALDVSVQAAVLNLLTDLRDELDVAYLFISHDIGVVAHIADRIAVMYRGAIVEEGPAREMLMPPYHPYTEALLSAVPVVGAHGRAASRIRLTGDVSSAPSTVGCRFAHRCPRHLGATCDTVDPPIRKFGEGHRIACHLTPDELKAMPPALAAE